MLQARTALVIGREPLLASVARQVAVAGWRPLLLDLTLLAAKPPEPDLARVLLDTDCALVIPPRGNPVGWVVRAVHLLRSQLSWEGSFIAIMPSFSTRAELSQVSLLADSPPTLVYGETHGHASIARPASYPAILTAITSTQPMYFRAWLKALELSQIRRLVDELRSAKLPKGSSDQAQLVMHIAEVFRSLDWRCLLKDPHRDLSEVKRIARLMSQTFDPLVVLQLMENLVERSWILSQYAK